MNNYIGSENIIKKKKKFLFPCSHHFYKDPPQIVRASMQYLYDDLDNKYLDFFSGVSVMNCGHSNPVILDATINQMKSLQHTTTIYLTQPIVDLAQRLADIMPGDITRSFFCCTGSEANEGAMLLARLYTNKKEFISLKNSLHGRTFLAMSVTDISMWRSDPYIDDCVTFVPNCYDKSRSLEEAAKLSIDAIKAVVNEKGDQIAALIAEPIQGNGGIITPPKWYFKEIKNILDKNNILLIIDEVQTGFGRSGKMFAIEHYDVTPDIITVAKALGNGMPISAFCTNDKIATSFNKASASTLGGNPVSSTTAIAVLDYIESNKLCDRAKMLGDKLKSGLNNLMKKYDIIHDVRGIGLMLGVELLKKDGSNASEEVDFILEEMKNNGIIIGKNGIGRNVLAFQPPLIIAENDIDLLLIKLDEVLSLL